MWSSIKSAFFRYVPTHIGNPFALIARMIRSRKRAAVFTLATTFLALLCIPLDLLLARKERRLPAIENGQNKPVVIFICGPARSGTTLVYQVLSQVLDCTFLQNFTMLFPRSPVTSTRIFRRLFGARHSKSGFDNYYGKTSGFFSPSEANHIWNRWVESDDTGFRTVISSNSAEHSAEFFRLFSTIDEKAVVCKNNNLNVFADQVADALPESIFICLRRDPRFLAQSLLYARKDIRGDISKGYGVQDVENASDTEDPVKAVCAQVQYLDRKGQQMQQRIGSDRFWIVQYEDFCANPDLLIQQIVEKTGVQFNESVSNKEYLQSITVHNGIRDASIMQQIDDELARLARNDSAESETPN